MAGRARPSPVGLRHAHRIARRRAAGAGRRPLARSGQPVRAVRPAARRCRRAAAARADSTHGPCPRRSCRGCAAASGAPAQRAGRARARKSWPRYGGWPSWPIPSGRSSAASSGSPTAPARPWSTPPMRARQGRSTSTLQMGGWPPILAMGRAPMPFRPAKRVERQGLDVLSAGTAGTVRCRGMTMLMGSCPRGQDPLSRRHLPPARGGRPCPLRDHRRRHSPRRAALLVGRAPGSLCRRRRQPGGRAARRQHLAA